MAWWIVGFGSCKELLWMDIMTWNISRRYSVDLTLVFFLFFAFFASGGIYIATCICRITLYHIFAIYVAWPFDATWMTWDRLTLLSSPLWTSTGAG